MAVLIVATSVTGFGVGAVFVAAAGSLFVAVQPREAGVASGALSTFHEFGAATGGSAVSSVAAAALLEPGFDAFARGYWFGAGVALVAGLASLAGGYGGSGRGTFDLLILERRTMWRPPPPSRCTRWTRSRPS